MPVYNVSVYYEGCYDTQIEADSRAEAEAIAVRQVDLGDGDADITSVYTEED